MANNPADDDAFSLAIYVPDVDAVLQAAREQGARVRTDAQIQAGLDAWKASMA